MSKQVHVLAKRVGAVKRGEDKRKVESVERVQLILVHRLHLLDDLVAIDYFPDHVGEHKESKHYSGVHEDNEELSSLIEQRANSEIRHQHTLNRLQDRKNSYANANV